MVSSINYTCFSYSPLLLLIYDGRMLKVQFTFLCVNEIKNTSSIFVVLSGKWETIQENQTQCEDQYLGLHPSPFSYLSHQLLERGGDWRKLSFLKNWNLFSVWFFSFGSAKSALCLLFYFFDPEKGVILGVTPYSPFAHNWWSYSLLETTNNGAIKRETYALSVFWKYVFRHLYSNQPNVSYTTIK